MKASVYMTFDCEIEGEASQRAVEMAFLGAWPGSVLLSEDYDVPPSDDWAILINSTSILCRIGEDEHPLPLVALRHLLAFVTVSTKAPRMDRISDDATKNAVEAIELWLRTIGAHNGS